MCSILFMASRKKEIVVITGAALGWSEPWLMGSPATARISSLYRGTRKGCPRLNIIFEERGGKALVLACDTASPDQVEVSAVCRRVVLPPTFPGLHIHSCVYDSVPCR